MDRGALSIRARAMKMSAFAAAAARLRRLLGGCVKLALPMLAACSSNPPMPAVARVDLQRIMGDWYVIAAIPSLPERDAYNAVESYALRPDGKIQTVFRYRSGGFDSPVKTMRPVGTVLPGSGNAVWGMQLIWPIEAEYVIADLAADYGTVIIGRSKRDYAWIMARTPQVAAADYQRLVETVARLGYPVEKLRKVPQQWPEPAP